MPINSATIIYNNVPTPPRSTTNSYNRSMWNNKYVYDVRTRSYQILCNHTRNRKKKITNLLPCNQKRIRLQNHSLIYLLHRSPTTNRYNNGPTSLHKIPRHPTNHSNPHTRRYHFISPNRWNHVHSFNHHQTIPNDIYILLPPHSVIIILRRIPSWSHRRRRKSPQPIHLLNLPPNLHNRPPNRTPNNPENRLTLLREPNTRIKY